VSTAAPLAVPETVVELPEELVPEALGVVDGGDAVALRTAGVWGWKARMPAVPATVAARTMGDRRMGELLVRT
jgi:hypothetical protein